MARVPAFTPGWQPREGSAGHALLQVFARHVETLTTHLDLAPARCRLAFFARLGVNLPSPGAARAPIVFHPLPTLGNGTVPAGTRVAAKIEGRPEPVVFETEHAMGLAAGRLVEVATVWPERDEWADHSQEHLRREPFELFEGRTPVRHELYLAHDLHFALTGRCTVELTVHVSEEGSRPLPLAWEYWDGELWREFKAFLPAAEAGDLDSIDWTDGLQRSGVLRLVAECATAQPTRVDGIEAHWVRARLRSRLPRSTGEGASRIDQVRVSTVIDRSLPFPCEALREHDGLIPDAAYADATKLDLSKAIQPFGARPGVGSVFYLSCAELLSKPRAQATLCLARLPSPEKQVDELAERYERAFPTAVERVAKAALAAAHGALSSAESCWELAKTSLLWIASPLTFNLKLRKDRLEAGITDFRKVLTNTVAPKLPPATGWGDADLSVLDELRAPAQELIRRVRILNDFWALMPIFSIPGIAVGLESPDGMFLETIDKLIDLVATILNAVAGDPPPDFSPTEYLEKLRTDNDARINRAAKLGVESTKSSIEALRALDPLTPYEATAVAVGDAPRYPEPQVQWEYWNGSRWAPLHVGGDADVVRFLASGSIEFTVPDDLVPTEVNDVLAPWVRARLVAGGYAVVRLVSFRDDRTKKMNFFPIIDHRPPTVDRVRLGYLFSSTEDSLQRCVSLNDFVYVDHTTAARTSDADFAPLVPVADRRPALYLGFDQPLPADLSSTYFEIEEVLGQEEGPALVWEFHDGRAWQPLRTHDGSGHLAVSGSVQALVPGAAPRRTAGIVSAREHAITVSDRDQAARFAAGARLYVEEGGDGEFVTVDGVSGNDLRTAQPLTRSYTGGTVGEPLLARFGTPRTWLRARLESPGEPRRARILGVYPNAAWASQVQTFEHERLGSSRGGGSQTFFLRNLPVVEGERIEVRELSGARAAVEEPVLRAELAASGVPEDDVRVEHDPRSGRVNAIWVRWHACTSLLFASAHDRVYELERTRGLLRFGDGTHGRIPPVGEDNVRVRRYRAGGGTHGNVARGAISELLSGVAVAGIENVRAAEGGADARPVESVHRSGPALVRHRSQAVTIADFEDMAREASSGVAMVRALAATHPSGRPEPGWVTLFVVPESDTARPSPSLELRNRVKRYLAARVPAAVAARITVLPARYRAVGVEARLSTISPDQGGNVLARARKELLEFFHPLRGGPDGVGWPFGRDVFVSDVASRLEALEGMDFVERLLLLVDGTPVGERAEVPANRIVVAGELLLTLSAGEDAR